MGKRKSSSELADDLADLGAEIRHRAVEETRADLARALEEMFVGGPAVDRRQFGGQSPTDCIMAALEDMTLPQLLAAVAAKIEDTDRVPTEFTAGVLFAARLLADPHFDY